MLGPFLVGMPQKCVKGFYSVWSDHFYFSTFTWRSFKMIILEDIFGSFIAHCRILQLPAPVQANIQAFSSPLLLFFFMSVVHSHLKRNIPQAFLFSQQSFDVSFSLKLPDALLAIHINCHRYQLVTVLRLVLLFFIFYMYIFILMF